MSSPARGGRGSFRQYGAAAAASSASAAAASATAAAGPSPVPATAAAAPRQLALTWSSRTHLRQRAWNAGGDEGGGAVDAAAAAAAAAAEPEPANKRRKIGGGSHIQAVIESERTRQQQRQAARVRQLAEDDGMDEEDRQELRRNLKRAERDFRKRFRERAEQDGRAPANGEAWTEEEYKQAVQDEAAMWAANRRAEQREHDLRRGIVPEEDRAPADVPMLDDVVAVFNEDVLDAEVDDMMTSMLAKTEAQCGEAMQRMRVSTAVNLSTDLLRDMRQCAGDLTMDAIARVLNEMGCTRSEHQAMFHDAFIQACLPMSVSPSPTYANG